MAQGRSTKIISMIQWIRTSRLSITKSLSLQGYYKAITQEFEGKGDKMELAAGIQKFISSVL